MQDPRLHHSIPMALNSPDLNPVDYRIWRVLQECVYPKFVKNVDELKQCLTEEWLDIQRSDIDQTLDQ